MDFNDLDSPLKNAQFRLRTVVLLVCLSSICFAIVGHVHRSFSGTFNFLSIGVWIILLVTLLGAWIGAIIRDLLGLFIGFFLGLALGGVTYFVIVNGIM